ncbi:HAD-like domain-containing protein [Triangularia setosa]|uniref:Mitochondrial import inner membrane translocase subunit TIM50 n=1 Tax=Triangularia setosa TaxID=2587417 RepID=A0AAN6WFB7_9PEZI|nr:HAD-like domain-containing protein [Podospora setosa]
MIRRKTTPLFVNVLDRVSQPQQLFLPIRVFGNRHSLSLLQSSQAYRSNLDLYFTCNLHSCGLATSAQGRPNPEPAAEESPFSCERESLLCSLATSQQLPRIPSLLSPHNFYPEPPAPAIEESSEPSTVSKELIVDTIESGSTTMDQNTNYQGFNGGWAGNLNPTAPPFQINPAGSQTYHHPAARPGPAPIYHHPLAQAGPVPAFQHPPAQPAPIPSPINSQGSHNKKKKRNRKGGERDNLSPRQRRKAARAADPQQQYQQQPGGSGPVNQLPNTRPPSSTMPPRPPPGLVPSRAPLTPQSALHTDPPPSIASGGVPNPSPSYLTRASFPPSPSPHPHPLLLVIDLNGTLLHRPSSRRSHNYIRRPHTEKFLAYCIDTFSVVIWSSARPDNVAKMCDTLLTSDQKGRVLAIWGRDKFNLTDKDYSRRVQVYKRLGTVWNDANINPNGLWDQGNTVLIDDSAEKARSEPHNAVTIPEFLGDLTPAEEGGREWEVLPAVHEYLNKLAATQDVSRFIRQSPFKMEMALNEEGF